MSWSKLRMSWRDESETEWEQSGRGIPLHSHCTSHATPTSPHPPHPLHLTLSSDSLSAPTRSQLALRLTLIPQTHSELAPTHPSDSNSPLPLTCRNRILA